AQEPHRFRVSMHGLPDAKYRIQGGFREFSVSPGENQRVRAYVWVDPERVEKSKSYVTFRAERVDVRPGGQKESREVKALFYIPDQYL
ncbi:MAG TPA: FixG Ig-like domain-containing protein, partial [Gammaproteobacteria bacterium]|nr:FixG Ig-like domain-containing protein [Gammaproteobacteria bacterium]